MKAIARFVVVMTLLALPVQACSPGAAVAPTPLASTSAVSTPTTAQLAASPTLEQASPVKPPPSKEPLAAVTPAPSKPTPAAAATTGPAAAPPSLATPSAVYPGMMGIPAGDFVMGDHFGFQDPKQVGSDEVPTHTVHVDAFSMAATETTNQQYVAFLAAALAQGSIEVRSGIVYAKGGSEIYFATRQADEFSPIAWDGSGFTILENRSSHPVTSVRWFGAVAYTNWLSVKSGLEPCFDLSTGKCDFTRTGYRLPTEAEWEYAARGGLKDPYANYPWGSDPDNTRANWPNSGDPYEVGPYPWTTPAGFYDGSLRRKADYAWPGAQATYQTTNGANGYGLYDVAGNVWEFVYDWYGRDYYRTSPRENPRGPDSGSPMPDGKAYRGMRGGNWYNGDFGWSRVSNRDPSYFRGPQDPNHPYYHVGFRVALDLHGAVR